MSIRSEIVDISIRTESNIADLPSLHEVDEAENYVLPAGYHDGYVTADSISSSRTYWRPVIHTNELTFNVAANDGWTLLYDPNEFTTVVPGINYDICFEDVKEEPQFPESPALDSFLDSFRIK